jgi:hypothetical protein
MSAPTDSDVIEIVRESPGRMWLRRTLSSARQTAGKAWPIPNPPKPKPAQDVAAVVGVVGFLTLLFSVKLMALLLVVSASLFGLLVSVGVFVLLVAAAGPIAVVPLVAVATLAVSAVCGMLLEGTKSK